MRGGTDEDVSKIGGGDGIVYSPFEDKNGNPLELSKIRFSHLGQLRTVDEGYKVEYKSTFDKSVKDKIPAIITSFANSEGGWLIIGIDDNSHEVTCIPKIRSDYSQTISQLLKERTSPIPAFDSRFIRNPKNKGEGVLVVEIYEGNFSPYVANGTVYIRNGSSKEPIKSERATIDFLYQKSQSFQNELAEFFKRNIYFPENEILFGRGKITYPICNVYFKNIHQSSQKRLRTYDDYAELCSQVTAARDGVIFSNVQNSFDSLIFRHKAIDPSLRSTTPTMEVFFDFSAKIHIPLGLVSEFEQKEMVSKLKQMGLINGDQIKICGGVDSFNCVFGVLLSLADIYEHYKIPISNFAVCFEIENANNTVLFFEGQKYLDEARESGLHFSSRTHSRSRTVFLKNYDSLDYHSLVSTLAYDFFAAEFGFSPSKSPEMIAQAVNEKYKFED